MDLPITNLKRDEYYTFIHGLAVACVWIAWGIHFKKLDILSSMDSIVSPVFIAAWLFSTAFLWILYNLITFPVIYCISKQLDKKKPDDLLRHHKVSGLSLFYTGPMEERQIHAHIFGLLTAALIISYYPISFLFPKNLEIYLLLHIIYTLGTIFILYRYKSNSYDLASVSRLITTGVCDVMNEKAYAQKRAEFFAELKHNEYKNKLSNSKQ
ncbi:MAG: hypothetical protein AB1798_11840 [Spirochaetota bacterium]